MGNEIKREAIKTESTEQWHELRAKDITSTESAALFGLSPYLTPFELWHRKKAGSVVQVEPNERMKWGTRLQDSIAAGIAEDQKWKIERRAQYERLTDLRMGASFDFTIVNEVCGRLLPTNVRCDSPLPCPHHGTEFAEKGGEQGLLEIKNVDPLTLRDNWIVDGDEIEAPPHIELQVQHQLLVSGLPFAYIGALVGGNRAVLIKREPLPEIIQSIVDKTEAFWRSIDANEAPKPNFAKDAAFVTKLQQEVAAGKAIDLSEDAELSDLAAAYAQHRSAIAQYEAKRDEVKARILMKIGDAEKVRGSAFSISAGTVKASRVDAFERPSYRNLRINFKKTE